MRTFAPFRHLPLTLALACAPVFPGCSESEKKADIKPAVGVLELPFSQRFSDREPSGATPVEVGPAEVRVDGEPLLMLDSGKVKPEDRNGFVVPKLKAKLSGKGALALTVHAAVPFATLARVVDSASEAGVKTLAFRVRKPGTATETGWLVLTQTRFTTSADQGQFTDAELLPWEAFAAHWDETLDACASAQNADCGYKPMAKAEGGKLDMLLRARGNGLALRFRQTGAPAKPPAPEKPKVEVLEGLKKKGKKGAPSVAAEEPPPPEPISEHMFSLRSQAAVVVPSPITGIVQPVCARVSCPAILEADGISMSGNVLSLIGAAFPDGTTEPRLSWVLPAKE